MAENEGGLFTVTADDYARWERMTAYKARRRDDARARRMTGKSANLISHAIGSGLDISGKRLDRKIAAELNAGALQRMNRKEEEGRQMVADGEEMEMGW